MIHFSKQWETIIRPAEARVMSTQGTLALLWNHAPSIRDTGHAHVAPSAFLFGSCESPLNMSFFGHQQALLKRFRKTARSGRTQGRRSGFWKKGIGFHSCSCQRWELIYYSRRSTRSTGVQYNSTCTLAGGINASENIKPTKMIKPLIVRAWQNKSTMW